MDVSLTFLTCSFGDLLGRIFGDAILKLTGMMPE
jgi:hypothetical protein